MRRYCVVCGGYYAVRKNCKLYKHTRVMGAAQRGYAHTPYKVETCPGSGLEGTVTRKDA